MKAKKFNNNIRCIEMQGENLFNGLPEEFNNNIRCIEIALNSICPILLKRLITT